MNQWEDSISIFVHYSGRIILDENVLSPGFVFNFTKFLSIGMLPLLFPDDLKTEE